MQTNEGKYTRIDPTSPSPLERQLSEAKIENEVRGGDVGKVILIGAGSGDPELITVKGMRYLQQAEVILTDRLVSPEIIRAYASPDAKVIYVGKQCRRGASTPQA